ncbi:MAG: mannitol-1-phosphate 5-dehydrogenase [Spirochaetaceae bacterium]|jgi:mannitol-1-phosphate 5-dehydrogenase|nr:mannitol-1-phosphate 5-dehydrogenase [Spirochaetaceae bacterium]
MKFAQIGAGNIGRSFIGALFSRAGWEVVFIDVDPRIVSLLNDKKYYTVLIKREGRADESRRIGPVRAVNGTDAESAAREIAGADLAATSVGKAALPKALPMIARGLEERRRVTPDRPLDFIIAENARGAGDLFRSILGERLGPDYPLDRLIGLVETSIGKMVPIMRREDLDRDPLLLFAEEYETLIADRLGFRGPPPEIPGLYLTDTISAYVDRKLFIHNLGHAAAAYLAYRADPGKKLLAEGLPLVEPGVKKAMNEAARALALEYPAVFGGEDLALHIADLLTRFKNRALGDTIHRVGRDLPRKLGREDRLVGAMLLCAGKGVPFEGIADAYGAALDFAAPGEGGQIFPEDRRFREEILPRGIPALLREVSGLDPASETDRKVMEVLSAPR